jgi:hypothetical protein
MNWKRTAIKATKVTAIVAGVAAGLAVMIVGLFLLRPVREQILSMALPTARRALPGTLAIESAQWPTPGSLQFDGVLWTSGPDTLAAVEHLGVSADLLALVRRDVHVEELVVRDARADIAALARLFEADSGTDDGDKDDSGNGGFLRDGAVRGVPSIAVDRVDIDVLRLRASETVDLREIVIRGGLNVLHGTAPELHFDEVRLVETTSGSSIDSLRVLVDLASFAVEGSGTITSPDYTTLYLNCRSTPEYTFEIRLAPKHDRDPPESEGVAIDGRVEMAGYHLQSIDFTIQFRTPGSDELQRIPALERVLAKPFEQLAPLDGVRGLARGHVALRPAFSADATVDLFRTTWLDTTHITASYRDETLSIETLQIGLPGLDLSARGRMPPSGGSVSATIRLFDAAQLARIVPDVSVPESLSVELTIDADGIVDAHETAVRLRGSARLGEYALNTLDVDANVQRRGDGPHTVDLTAALVGGVLGEQTPVVLRTLAEITTAPAIIVNLTAPDGNETDPVSQGGVDKTQFLTGGIRYDPNERSLKLADLRLQGSLGSYSADAALDSLLRGSFGFDCEWIDPPELLLAMVSADSAARDTVRSRWIEDGPFSIRAVGTLGREGDEPVVTASAVLHLPGPRTAAPLFPDSVAVDDLGPVEGTLGFEMGPCDADGRGDDGRMFDVRLDLGETSWLDTAFVDLRGCGGSITLDTVRISFESLRIAAEGGAVDGVWDLSARIALADSQLVTRLRPGVDAPSVAIDVGGRLEGSTDDWRLFAEVDGRFATAEIRIPRIEGRIELAADTLEAQMTLPRGLSSRALVLDSVSVVNRGSLRGGITEGAAEIQARGPDVDFVHAVRWAKDGAITVHGDTLYLRVVNGTLASLRPYALNVADGALNIADMALEGSLGRVRADGYVSSDSADFAAQVVIHAPEKPRFLEMADRLWPDSLRIDARIDGPTTIRAEGKISGISLSEGNPVSARFELGADSVAAGARFAVESPDRTLLAIEARLPTYRLGESLQDGPVVLDVRLNEFPVPVDPGALTAEKTEELGRLSGRIAVRGMASDPCAVGALRCDFTGGQELSNYKLVFEFRLIGDAPLDTALVRIGNQLFQTTIAQNAEAPGLSARLSMTKSNRPILTGELVYPLSFSLAPLALGVRDPAEAKLKLESEALALTDLDPMLPPDLNLEGTCTISLDAAGNARNPSLKGSLRTNKVQILSARGAQIAPDVEIDIGGTWERPSISGQVQVRSGFIRMPKPKTHLHPVDGQALLWESASPAGIDSTLEGPPTPRGWHDKEQQKPVRAMDIDIEVVIPGAFRIIGDRLNAELSGDLRLVKSGPHLVLTGQLTPLGGTLLFMGRTFEIRRGYVNFYGGDEMNPSFDLLLQADVDQVRVDIKLTGTADEPIVELTSDPMMSESDIMSLLLFGRRAGDLSSSQSGLLQQRTAEMLLVFGASKLQSQMSKELGVDIVTVQQSTRQPDQSALVVGKYLNTRTLLKYEQNLQKAGTYLIILEYILTKRIKLQTFIDQASESGAEINWSKDY